MKSQKSKIRTVIVGGILISASVVVLGVIVYRWLDEASRNLAEESIAPISRILKDGGAVEKCSRGDSGKGPDNKAPNYTMIFETSLNRQQAIELAERAASNNGYRLERHDSSVYPEIISLDDNSTKQSSFEELEKGYITLGIGLYDGGSHLGCANTKMKYDKDHTAIKVDISLPNYRR